MKMPTLTLATTIGLAAAGVGYVLGSSERGEPNELAAVAGPEPDAPVLARRDPSEPSPPPPSTSHATPPPSRDEGHPAPSRDDAARLQTELAELSERHEAVVAELASLRREHARLRAARIEGLKQSFLASGRAEGLTPEQTDDALALIGDLGELPEGWQLEQYLDVVAEDRKLLARWADELDIEYDDLRNIHRNLDVVLGFAKTMADRLPGATSFRHRINGVVVPSNGEFLAEVKVRDEVRRGRLEQIFGRESARRVYRR